MERITRLSNTTLPSKCIKGNEKGNSKWEETTSTFCESVYNEDIGQMLDYKKLINHNNLNQRCKYAAACIRISTPTQNLTHQNRYIYI